MTENYTQGNPQGVSLASVFQEEDQALSSRRKFHASYLNPLDGTSPFPKAFDEPAAPRAICEAVQAKNGGFIVSVPKPYGPYNNLEALCMRFPNTTTP